MVDNSVVDAVLQTYELSEIFELNELTEEEVLLFCVEQGLVVLPRPRPL
jgi:hypothetical protein